MNYYDSPTAVIFDKTQLLNVCTTPTYTVEAPTPINGILNSVNTGMELPTFEVARLNENVERSYLETWRLLTRTMRRLREPRRSKRRRVATAATASALQSKVLPPPPWWTPDQNRIWPLSEGVPSVRWHVDFPVPLYLVRRHLHQMGMEFSRAFTSMVDAFGRYFISRLPSEARDKPFKLRAAIRPQPQTASLTSVLLTCSYVVRKVCDAATSTFHTSAP